MSYFAAKMHQIQFRLGLCPRPRWWSLQRPQTHWLVLSGPTSKGRGGAGRGGKGGVEAGRGGEGRDPWFWVTPPEIES